MISHSGIKPFKCTVPTCQKEFKRNCELKVHIDRAHIGIKPFKCEICSKAFNRNSQLRAHNKRFHHNFDDT